MVAARRMGGHNILENFEGEGMRRGTWDILEKYENKEAHMGGACRTSRRNVRRRTRRRRRRRSKFLYM